MYNDNPALIAAGEQDNPNRQVLQYLPYAILELSETGTILYANPKAQTLLQQSADKLINSHIQLWLKTSERNFYQNLLSQAQTVGELKKLSVLSISGLPQNFELSLTPLPKNSFLFSLLPIAEKDLNQSNKLQQQFRIATKSAGIGVWVYEYASDHLEWDEQMFQLYGLDPAEFEGNYQGWAKRLHPDDLIPTENLYQQCVNEQTTLDTNFRILTAFGEEKVLKVYGHIQFDQNNNPISIIGVNYDITAYAHAQQQLKVSLKENEFLAKVAQETDNGVFITDAELKIQWINQSFSHLTGFGLDEVYQHPPCEILFGSETKAEHIQALGQLPQNRQSFSQEVLHYHKQGHTFWARISLQPLFEFEQLKGFMAIMLDITQEKLQQASLRNITNMQQAILDSANLTIVSTNTQGVIQTFNKGAQSALGYTEQEVVGKLTPVIFHDNSEIKARARKLSIQMGQKIAPGFDVFTIKAGLGLPDEREWTYIRKDGSRFPVMLTITALYSADGELEGFLGIGRNQEELKRFELEKVRTQKLLEATEKMAKVGGWEYELKSQKLFWSQEVYRIHELPLNSDIDVTKAIEFYAPEARSIVEQAMQRAIEKGLPWDLKLPFVTAKGRKIWVRAYGYPVQEDGITYQLKGAFQDITETKEAEEKAKAASRAKSEFLANMSHELRTPINGVIGMNELLLKTQLSQTQQHYAELAQASSHSLLHLINDILDLSKIEAGKLEIENIAFNLDDLLTSITDTFKLKAQEKSLALEYAPENDLPSHIEADPIRLRQIINNLLSNAIKFTAEGQISLKVKQLANDKLRFEIKDSGIGIAQDKLEHLFDKFTQADASTTRKYGGTGLGLAISKQLAEMMGGRIGVSSGSRHGAEFWFEISYLLPKHQVLDASLSDKKLLLVVQDSELQTELRTKLRPYNPYIQCCSGASEAIKQLKQNPTVFDMVFIQQQLSGLDGIQLAKAIRNGVSSPMLPLVLLATNSQTPAIPEVNAWLAPPYDTNQLLNTILLSNSSTSKPEVTQAQAKPTVAEKHILLVEDNFINQQVAMEMLKSQGYQVSMVDNGQQALDFLAETTHAIDLVLMDCQMPIMDGYEATHHIRHDHSGKINPSVPIIALTANALEGDKDKCLAAGMSGYLSKPIVSEKLEVEIQKWLS